MESETRACWPLPSVRHSRLLMIGLCIQPLRQRPLRWGSLLCNHPFVDGNKRIGMMVMLLFLELNGAVRSCADEEIVRVGLGLADGTIDYQALLQWILD